ncbi:MAG: VOC family protein, partial [Saprospiraceae bacterium]|nr:VOC family protein [Saprospiraceae bacterium]
MKDIFRTYHPAGFHSVNAYLFVSDPEQLIDFLKKAFWANELNRSTSPDGRIGNCIMRIGDSCFMISQARGKFEGMRTSFYLYVSNVDEVYENALSHG